MTINNLSPTHLISGQSFQDKSLEQSEGVTILSTPEFDPMAYKEVDQVILSWSIYKGEGTGEERFDMARRYLSIYAEDMPTKIAQAREAFDSFHAKVYRLAPSLKDKAWDFSIDSQNQVSILELETLSDHEKMAIAQAFDQQGLAQPLSELRSIMIEALENQRGPEKYTTGIGRYELNQDNFGEIVRIREFMSNAQGRNTHMNALATQLASRAEDVYSELETYTRTLYLPRF